MIPANHACIKSVEYLIKSGFMTERIGPKAIMNETMIDYNYQPPASA
jgi:hypothetical protein